MNKSWVSQQLVAGSEATCGILGHVLVPTGARNNASSKLGFLPTTDQSNGIGNGDW
jgi:hypothetical protein